MLISLFDFKTLVSNMGAAVQGACTTLLDFTAGSVVRSIQEASASQGLWLQYLVVQVLMMCRLSTSSGAQVDSWFADYGLTRDPAVEASARITANRYVASGSAVLLVGSTCLTSDGLTTFVVGIDPTVTGYDQTQGGGVGGYIIPEGTASLANIPVTAAVAGTAGNVSANTITQIGGIPGIDYCNNPAAATGGLDEETDAAMKARFPLFIASLDRATLTAVESAIGSVQAGLTYFVAENQNEAGGAEPGHFVITIDDGSGSPSPTLKSAVYAAVDPVRPVGSTFSVQSPQILYVTIALTLTVGTGSSTAALRPSLQTAIAAYVNALGVGQTLALSRITVIAYGISPYVNNVTLLTANGATADIVPSSTQVIKLTSATVN